MTTFQETISLTKIDCGMCGASYAINERFRQKCEQEGHSWTCPYCKCVWGYTNNNENSRLKKELEQKQRDLTAAKCETLRQEQLREKAEKKLRRVHNGVCPCCKRSFQNLQRHMATVHAGKTVK
jgi:hypothetical protein